MQNTLAPQFDSPAARPVPPGGTSTDPIDALLVESGLAALTSSSGTTDQENALQTLASGVAGLTPLRRIIVRDRAIQVLKRGGFESPARLVDAALSGSLVAEPSTEAGSDLLLAMPQPWAEQVDGVTLVAEIESAIAAHAMLPEGAAVAMALWIIHTYCLGAAAITPRLAIVSPTKRCGKTAATTFASLSSTCAIRTEASPIGSFRMLS